MFHTIRQNNTSICFQFTVTAHMKNTSVGCTFTMARHSSCNRNINRITMKENISVAQNEKTDNETAYEEQPVSLTLTFYILYPLSLTFALNYWSIIGLTTPQDHAPTDSCRLRISHQVLTFYLWARRPPRAGRLIRFETFPSASSKR